MPAQMVGKDLAAGFNRFLFGHMLEAPALPCLGQALDDEGRCGGIELVNMRPDPAMRRLFKDEGEGIVEFLMRAQPDKLAAADVDVGLETCAYSSRTFEFNPSEATTRS
jgi:hypothetical protein